MSEKPNIVLVHGAWADGSCWSAVIESLQADGYTVTAPQFPETSLAADGARLRQVLRRQTGHQASRSLSRNSPRASNVSITPLLSVARTRAATQAALEASVPNC